MTQTRTVQCFLPQIHQAGGPGSVMVTGTILTPLKNPAFRDRFLRGVRKEIAKKVHNGSENSENKKKYRVAEKLAKKYHDLGPNGIVHNSG